MSLKTNKILNKKSKDSNGEINLSNLLIDIENKLIPIVDFLNENEVIIRTSGNMWNQLFGIINKFNNLKKNLIDTLDIPKSEELWKSIYESEKNNLLNNLKQINDQNIEKFKSNQ